jgi:hypothetical protein
MEGILRPKKRVPGGGVRGAAGGVVWCNSASIQEAAGRHFDSSSEPFQR